MQILYIENERLIIYIKNKMEYLIYLVALWAFINMCIQSVWLYLWIKDRKDLKHNKIITDQIELDSLDYLEKISFNTLNTSKNTYFNKKDNNEIKY